MDQQRLAETLDDTQAAAEVGTTMYAVAEHETADGIPILMYFDYSQMLAPDSRPPGPLTRLMARFRARLTRWPCHLGSHAWELAGEWRAPDTGKSCLPSTCYENFRGQTFLSSGHRIRVQCGRCGRRGYGRFVKRIGYDAWIEDGPIPRWELFSDDGRPVGGCPPQAEIEEALG
jgi:hypothetical protein